MPALFNEAEKWAKLGLKIVPVKLGLGSDGKKTVTCFWKWQTDPYPSFENLNWQGANAYGIVLGETSQGWLICVDADLDSGFDAYTILTKAFPELSTTYIERTPNGFHFFIFIDKPLDASNINIKTKNGLELHVNGLIFMAPSSYEDSKYEVYNHIDILREPDFYQKFQKAFGMPKKEVDLGYILNGVEEGERNEAAIQLASWYRRREKLSKEETKKKIEDWNTKNTPPLPRAELQNVLESAFRNVEPYHYYFINEPYTTRKLEPTESEFFSRRGFEPVLFAKHIMENYKIRTIRNNQTIHVYNPRIGIYEPTGEVTIKEEMSHVLGEDTRSRYFADVKFYIQGETGFDRPKNPTKKIATYNGLLDPETGEFTDFSSDEFVTIQIPVTYEPSTQCPKIFQFIKEVVTENQISVTQELIGYCLYIGYPFHRAGMLVGDGANGKSTLINLIKRFLGKDNTSDVGLHSLCTNRFAPAQLYNKLAKLCPDLPDESLSKTGMFKMLTGGDTIAAEQKFKDMFSFSNHAKLIFSANKVPETNDDTIAYFRRWITITCPNFFPPGKADPHILDKMCTPTEMSGLLNWAIEGLQRLFRQGQFSENKTWEQKRTSYIRASNSAKAFIQENLVPSGNHEDMLNEAELYSTYLRWCSQENLPSKRKAEFTTNMFQFLPGAKQTKTRIGENTIHVWQYANLVPTVPTPLFNTEKLKIKKGDETPGTPGTNGAQQELEPIDKAFSKPEKRGVGGLKKW